MVYSLDHKSVLWLGHGRSRVTLRESFKLLTEEERAKIKAVAMDQSTAFDIEVKEQCPNAVIVFDLFHVLTNYGRKVILSSLADFVSTRKVNHCQPL